MRFNPFRRTKRKDTAFWALFQEHMRIAVATEKHLTRASRARNCNHRLVPIPPYWESSAFGNQWPTDWYNILSTPESNAPSPLFSH